MKLSIALIAAFAVVLPGNPDVAHYQLRFTASVEIWEDTLSPPQRADLDGMGWLRVTLPQSGAIRVLIDSARWLTPALDSMLGDASLLRGVELLIGADGRVTPADSAIHPWQEPIATMTGQFLEFVRMIPPRLAAVDTFRFATDRGRTQVARYISWAPASGGWRGEIRGTTIGGGVDTVTATETGVVELRGGGDVPVDQASIEVETLVEASGPVRIRRVLKGTLSRIP